MSSNVILHLACVDYTLKALFFVSISLTSTLPTSHKTHASLHLCCSFHSRNLFFCIPTSFVTCSLDTDIVKLCHPCCDLHLSLTMICLFSASMSTMNKFVFCSSWWNVSSLLQHLLQFELWIFFFKVSLLLWVAFR